jgi:DNA-binding MurR/RpiR family transcriptional regulator
MPLADALRSRGGSLSPAERRVAEVVVADPEAVAFGTVADVAERAGASPATVVRAATRLGFDGFPELQRAAQTELSQRLRPAAERIRQEGGGDLLDRARATEAANVDDTLGRVDRAALDQAVTLLADPGRAVFVLSGDASSGIADQAASELSMLRPQVRHVTGTEVEVGRALTDLAAGDVVLALDLRRYDRWLVAAVDGAAEAGAEVVALTDGALSPLAARASYWFVVVAEGTGPFDSYVGALALLSTLTAGVAEVLRASATGRLDRIEAAWHDGHAFLED